MNINLYTLHTKAHTLHKQFYMITAEHFTKLLLTLVFLSCFLTISPQKWSPGNDALLSVTKLSINPLYNIDPNRQILPKT